MNHFLDCKGKTCPLPVIETKRLIEGEDVRELEIVVDNETSRENVKRFIESRGFTVDVTEKEGDYHIRASKSLIDEERFVVPDKKLLIFIDGETVGRGSDELGRVLMRSFLLTLKELNPLPWRIIFINSGVKLAVKDSPYLPALSDLVTLGTEIISCGTCLDYYRVKDKLMVGRISNMYEIESSFLEATNVIKP
jgi:selenium metabolism protein YedF